MNTPIMSYAEFNARMICIIKNNGNIPLCKSFFSWLVRSTLSLDLKLKMLKKIPTTNEELELLIAILKSHYNSKLYECRDFEWACFIGNTKPVESIQKTLNKPFKMIA